MLLLYNLTRKNLLTKLLITKVKRSVRVVIVIATPACFITFKNVSVESSLRSHQPHPMVDRQVRLLLRESLQSIDQCEHVVDAQTFAQLFDQNRERSIRGDQPRQRKSASIGEPIWSMSNLSPKRKQSVNPARSPRAEKRQLWWFFSSKQPTNSEESCEAD